MHVDLVSPFPPNNIPLLWEWLHEFPLQNFDDGGPKTLREFSAALKQREAQGQIISEVRYEGEPVGVVGIARTSPSQVEFCGVCFTRKVHGKGVALAAIRKILAYASYDGVRSAVATYFADNVAVAKMFKKLGAVEVDSFLNPTKRKGQAVTCTKVMIDLEAEMVGVPSP